MLYFQSIVKGNRLLEIMLISFYKSVYVVTSIKAIPTTILQ